MRLPVQTAACWVRPVGAPPSPVAMGVQVSVAGLYRPPVSSSSLETPWPPQTSRRLPVQAAVWKERRSGAFSAEMGVQVSATGSYRPPVPQKLPASSWPPQIRTALPVHTAEWRVRAAGGFVVETGVQESAAGSYRPPVRREGC